MREEFLPAKKIHVPCCLTLPNVINFMHDTQKLHIRARYKHRASCPDATGEIKEKLLDWPCRAMSAPLNGSCGARCRRRRMAAPWCLSHKGGDVIGADC